MTTYYPIVSGSVTTSVVTVQLDQPYDTIKVINRGSQEIAFSLDGTNPTVGGNGNYLVPAAVGATITVEGLTSIGPTSNVSTTGSVVKLIAAGATTYTVWGQ